MRPLESSSAYACGVRLSSHCSDVCPPEPRKKPMFGICGMRFASNSVRKIEWLIGRSTSGYSDGRQDFAQLAEPVIPRVASPRVVGPEEAALLQIRAKRLDFLRREERAAVIRHHEERALEQLGLGRLNDDVVGRAVLVEIDSGLRELGEPNRQVLVGARIIDAPPAAEAAVARREMPDGRTLKSPLKVSAPGPAHAVVTAAAALSSESRARKHERQNRHHDPFENHRKLGKV